MASNQTHSGLNLWSESDKIRMEDFNADNLRIEEILRGTGIKGERGEQGPQGVQGEQGPKGDTGDTGPQGVSGIGLAYRGPWDTAADYTVGDAVSHENVLWHAAHPSQGQAPGTTGGLWERVLGFSGNIAFLPVGQNIPVAERTDGTYYFREQASYQVPDVAPPDPDGYFVYGVRIGDLDNPGTTTEYTDDAVGMTPLSEDRCSPAGAESPFVHSNCDAAFANGRLYILGGYVDKVCTKRVSSYNVQTGGWESHRNMSLALRYHCAAALGENIYVFGGHSFTDNTTTQLTSYQTACYRYNTTANTWHSCAAIPQGVINASAVAVGDNIYVVGGRSSTATYANTIFVYNTANNTWQTRTMEIGRSSPSVWAYDGKLYITGAAELAADKRAVEIYDIAQGTSAIVQLDAAIVNTGSVCAVGGRAYYMGNGLRASAGSTARSPLTWLNLETLQWEYGRDMPFTGNANYRLYHDAASNTLYLLSAFKTVYAYQLPAPESDWMGSPLTKLFRLCLFHRDRPYKYLNPCNMSYGEEDQARVDSSLRNHGDVMVEIPRLAYYIDRRDNTLEVKITNHPDAKQLDRRFCYSAHTHNRWGDVRRIYLGSFMGSVDNRGPLPVLSSAFTYPPQTGLPLSRFKELAANKGPQYGIMDLATLTLLQCLFLIYYRSLDSRTAMGPALTGRNGVLNTGASASYGMFFGGESNTLHTRFLGLESLWGNVYCMIDNAEAGDCQSFLPQSPDGDGQVVLYGGKYDDGDEAHAFRMLPNLPGDYQDEYTGARLMYRETEEIDHEA